MKINGFFSDILHFQQEGLFSRHPGVFTTSFSASLALQLEQLETHSVVLQSPEHRVHSAHVIYPKLHTERKLCSLIPML